MKKVILFWFLLVVAANLTYAIADDKEVSNESGLKDVTSLEMLKQDFNVHQDKVRIVTLLSPT
jgi:hypothetical protein